MKTVGVGVQPDESLPSSDVPMDCLRLQGVDDILLDSGSLVNGQFRTEVDRPRFIGDLDDEFGSPADDVAELVGLPPTLGFDPERDIGMDLAQVVEGRRAAKAALDAGVRSSY